VAEDWEELTGAAMALLQREMELLEIVQLVGPDALAEAERAELAVARMLREDFLQQSAYHEIDRFCPLDKAYWMLKTIMTFHRNAMAAVDRGITVERITSLDVVEELARLKELPTDRAVEAIQAVVDRVEAGFGALGDH
jgi:V/A-type H+/Na+-transporting ATPase subunit A